MDRLVFQSSWRTCSESWTGLEYCFFAFFKEQFRGALSANGINRTGLILMLIPLWFDFCRSAADDFGDRPVGSKKGSRLKQQTLTTLIIKLVARSSSNKAFWRWLVEWKRTLQILWSGRNIRKYTKTEFRQHPWVVMFHVKHTWQIHGWTETRNVQISTWNYAGLAAGLLLSANGCDCWVWLCNKLTASVWDKGWILSFSLMYTRVIMAVSAKRHDGWCFCTSGCK